MKICSGSKYPINSLFNCDEVSVCSVDSTLCRSSPDVESELTWGGLANDPLPLQQTLGRDIERYVIMAEQLVSERTGCAQICTCGVADVNNSQTHQARARGQGPLCGENPREVNLDFTAFMIVHSDANASGVREAISSDILMVRCAHLSQFTKLLLILVITTSFCSDKLLL